MPTPYGNLATANKAKPARKANALFTCFLLVRSSSFWVKYDFFGGPMTIFASPEKSSLFMQKNVKQRHEDPFQSKMDFFGHARTNPSEQEVSFRTDFRMFTLFENNSSFENRKKNRRIEIRIFK